MRFRPAPPRLHDCTLHGPESGAELFVVEGRSAAESVLAVRDARRQAVLPLQGKPLNGARASAARVAADPFLGALADALGTGRDPGGPLDGLRYERVLLLLDPDADGVHIGALLLMHVARWLAPLLESGRLERVHAPIGELRGPDGAPPELAFGEAHFRALAEHARARPGEPWVARRYRGLGGIDPATLRRACVDPASRLTRVLDARDARLAVAVFGVTEPVRRGAAPAAGALGHPA
ncbi:MAG TPA: toprim domain-containing protein [Burkholderiaceae bacterium]|nr:toprim domain-containing protein [Burkholderiaceae bacterium]